MTAPATSSTRRRRPHYEGDPTLRSVMVRPKWILALIAAMIVAAVFAWLGKWQFEHAILEDRTQGIESEVVRPIGEVNQPGQVVTDGAGGMAVSVAGEFVPGEYHLVEQRKNGDQMGLWVIGHLQTDEPAGHLAVALAWAPDHTTATRALDSYEQEFAGRTVSFEGRYMPSEGPTRPEPGDDVNTVRSMAPAQLVNLWQPFSGSAFAGYLVAHPGADVTFDGALEPIDSVPPLPVERINWVSLFYALEWVVFAGFAVFFWYRLVRDEWEKTHELQELQAAEAQKAAAGQD